MTGNFETTEAYMARIRKEAKENLELIYDEGTPGDITEWFMNHCKQAVGNLSAEECVKILFEVDDEILEKNGG